MKFLGKNSTQRIMNQYGAEGCPFLFIISYDTQQNLVMPLEQINPEEIRYIFRGTGNVKEQENGNAEIDFERFPIRFERYSKAFNEVQAEIALGNSYLLNLTFPTAIETRLGLEELFRISSAPYKLWVKDRFVVFSPEIFVQIKDAMISSFPMKGTIDAAIENAENVILNDVKETAEHYTITDLIRNDLSAIAERVRVKRFRFIDTIQTSEKDLLQVSSEIQGELAQDWKLHLGDIFFSLLPAGSITGAPKKRTMEIIRRAEGYDRGFYTGVCGIFNGQEVDSAVMIRFIEQSEEGKLYYKSGGGITAFSNAEAEYQELIDKVYVPVV
jgi:para-aminobenzoate synthetase component 1